MNVIGMESFVNLNGSRLSIYQRINSEGSYRQRLVYFQDVKNKDFLKMKFLEVCPVTIPTELGKCRGLISLTIGSITTLKILGLEHNNFSVSIPPTVVNLTNLYKKKSNEILRCFSKYFSYFI